MATDPSGHASAPWETVRPSRIIHFFLHFLLSSYTFMPERFFFLHFLTTFLKKCSPPSVGSVILKIGCKQNLQKKPSRHPKAREKVVLWGYIWHIEICKFPCKNVYFCFMALLGVHVVCHLLFGLCCFCPIRVFRYNSDRFLQKCAPRLRWEAHF